MKGTQQDPRIEYLHGDRIDWWDVVEQRRVTAQTAYIAFGCPDWGEKGGKRNDLCTFCSLPNAVAEYRNAFYVGQVIPIEDHTYLFRETLKHLFVKNGAPHTLMVFNAGSFLAMPIVVQRAVAEEIALHASIKNVVIESRAPLIKEEILGELISILGSEKRLTVRIGVESKDDDLRLKVLKKGHSRAQLTRAVEVMKKLGVYSGGYALLNPAPGLGRAWATQEAIDTVNWILGHDGLGMNEAYLGPTCVGPDSPISVAWKNGQFAPPRLTDVLAVLLAVLPEHGGKVHLLPFKDNPPFLAVPSNHVQMGLPQSLEGAQGCDLEFHRMFDEYRATMDINVLRRIRCECAN